MPRNDNPQQEGHTKEWADRARVVLHPKEDVKEKASPKQSPEPADEIEDVEEKSKKLENDNNAY